MHPSIRTCPPHVITRSLRAPITQCPFGPAWFIITATTFAQRAFDLVLTDSRGGSTGSTINLIPSFILLHRPFAARRARREPSLRGLHCRASPNFPPLGINHPFFGFLTLGMCHSSCRGLGDRKSLASPAAGDHGESMFCTVLGGAYRASALESDFLKGVLKSALWLKK